MKELAIPLHRAAVGVRQLRDPFILAEIDIWVMFYSCAGESGISASRFESQVVIQTHVKG